MVSFVQDAQGCEICYGGKPVLRFEAGQPFCRVGSGSADFSMQRGSFRMREKVREEIPLYLSDDLLLRDSSGLALFSLQTDCGENQIRLHLEPLTDRPFNRLWFGLPGEAGEHIYGCGEHFTRLDLRGEKVRIWVQEHQNLASIAKKVLRETLLGPRPRHIDKKQHSYYRQPTYISSRKYFVHAHGNAYMEFDFRGGDYTFYAHALADFTIGFAPDYETLMETLTSLLGRQPRLPDWAYDGAILGVQGGTEAVEEKLARVRQADMRVAGVWCQDWQGARITAVGKQLFWNWQWDSAHYLGLDEKMHAFKRQGVRFLGYINPFLAIEGPLYAYASPRGYCVKRRDGGDYLTRSTTFSSAMVDFTNPAAYQWLKGVIKENVIGFGLDGWMADFGEYLPTDCVLHSGEDPALLHNAWPAIWARLNREAIEESGRLGEIFFFTRAGYTGTAAHSTLMWNGDQYTDWSFDGGFPSVIPAALSLACSGFGLAHSDIGGFSTFLHVKRSPELMLRWAEMNAFSPLFRSHEGVRPDNNAQFDAPEVIAGYAKMSRVHAHLKPYLQALDRENHSRGVPVMRPLFFYYGGDEDYTQAYEYLLGRDILVAPVLEPGRADWEVYLPGDTWVHLWTGKTYGAGKHTVPAPLGEPPVFCRRESSFLTEFLALREA